MESDSLDTGNVGKITSLTFPVHGHLVRRNSVVFDVCVPKGVAKQVLSSF